VTDLTVSDPYFDEFPAGFSAANYFQVGCGAGCAFADLPIVGWTSSVTRSATGDSGQWETGLPQNTMTFNSDPLIDGTTPEPIVARAINATVSQIVSTPAVAGATYTLDVDLGFEKTAPDAASVYLIVDGHQVEATPLASYGLTQTQMQDTGNWYDFEASYTATSADAGAPIEILLSSQNNGDGFGFFGNVRLASAGNAVAPTISGTGSGLTTTSEAPVTPFAGATIGDANADATDTLTITLGGAGGTLADGTGFNSLTTIGGGVYTLSGTASAITSELDALIFTPTAGAPNTSSTTTFALSDQSSAGGASAFDGAATVVDSDPAVAGNETSDVLLQSGGTVVDWIIRDGAYQSGNVLTTGAAGWNVVGTGDFTGNGMDDVLLQNGGTVADWILQNGQYSSGNLLTAGASDWSVVGTGDFTGNGVSDVLLQNGGSVVDWIMNDGAYQSGNVLTTGAAGWNVVGTGDFTGNGTDDVLLQNGGTVADWIMQNGQYETGNILTTAAAGWKVVGTGDFTGNGTDDVLLQNGGTVVDWIMQNGKYETGNVLTTAAAGWNVVGTGDFTGNGTDDILLQNGGTVAEWIMNNGAYQSGRILTTNATGWKVVNGAG
jgi:uncharacterized protein YukJ